MGNRAFNSKTSSNEGMNNPQSFLDEALQRQGLDDVPVKLKEVWVDGDYRYTVRVYKGNPAYTNADSIYRVSRKYTILDANGQGKGLEYLGTDGIWYPESVLKEFYKDGSLNPVFNEGASIMTHIPVK